jgi:hypothetical protein
LRIGYTRLLSPERNALETFPDLGALSDQALKNLIQELHGRIDILRAELVNRRQGGPAEGGAG